jgi:hypothetical protein
MRSTKWVGIPAVCAATVAFLAVPAEARTLTDGERFGAWQTVPYAQRFNRLEIRAFRTNPSEDLFRAAAGLELLPTGELPNRMPFVPSLYLNEAPEPTQHPAPLVVPPTSSDKDPGSGHVAEAYPGGSLDLAIASVALLASRRWRSPMAQ